MNTRKSILGVHLLFAASFLAVFLIAAPAWSAPGVGKEAVKNSTEERLADREDGKERGVVAKGQKLLKKKSG